MGSPRFAAWRCKIQLVVDSAIEPDADPGDTGFAQANANAASL
jgi:hypothetical protein